ncbi:MAG: hypothetical protein HUU17_06915 [Chthonomonadales bacterium]|nr:hypothetical protein [Chthonomonadales bacterium]
MLRFRSTRLGLALVAVLIILAAVGCGGGGNGDLKKAAADAEAVANRVGDVLRSNGGIENPTALDEARRVAAADERVREVVVGSDGSLGVTMRSGGRLVWVQDMPKFVPPDMPALRAEVMAAVSEIRRGRAPTGNQNAAVVNTLSDDPALSDASSMLDLSADLLEALGYRVERINGAAATVERFRELSSASLILYLGHSGVPGNYSMMTGQ